MNPDDCRNRGEAQHANPALLASVTVRLPGTFWSDHIDRGCIGHPYAEVWTPARKVVTVTLSVCDLLELKSDAAHYADGDYADLPGLVASAKATLGAIERSGLLVNWARHLVAEPAECGRTSCTNPVPAPAGPGRPAKFCSTACKQADYRDRRDREGIDAEAARRDVLDTLDNWAGRLMLDTPAERRAFLELVAMDVANELATLA